MATTMLAHNTLYYDSRCSFCSFFARMLKNIFVLHLMSSWDGLYTKKLMLEGCTWVYVDGEGKEFYKAEALLRIFETKRITFFLFAIGNVRIIKQILNVLYTRVAKHRVCSTGDYVITRTTKLLGCVKKVLLGVLLMYIVLILGVCLYFRQSILFYAGSVFFEGRLYNVGVAKSLLILADKSDDTKIKWLNYQLARVYFIEGGLSTSIMYANKELQYHPKNCRTHYIRGLAFAYFERLDAAIADFETFNTCFPLTWAGHNDLAWFWFRKGDMKKVIEVSEKVTSIYPTNPWIQNTYGTALMNVGRYTDAKKALSAAKKSADAMSEKDWGIAYPGNNPRVYKKGLYEMRRSIDSNLELLEKKRI